jgi:hypothetical protein
VFDDPGVAPIRDAAAAGRVEVCVDAVCEEELARVLARGFGKRTLDAQAQAACVAQCRRLAVRIPAFAGMTAPFAGMTAPFAGMTASEWAAARAALPACRDPDDQKFLEAALAAGAQFLITKDRELLALGKKQARVPFRIVTPAEFGNSGSDPQTC